MSEQTVTHHADQPAIKERPILFSGSMVRAILEGRKTVTRRVIKVQPFDLSWSRRDHTFEYSSGRVDLGDEIDGFWAYTTRSGGQWEAKCPYGQPGDRLWVRETFAFADKSGTHDAAPDDQWRPARPGMEPDVYRCWYRASDGHTADGFWNPSIHMPRWASRILLEITAVHVERLHDISDDQAEAEGVDRPENITNVDVWDGAERELFNAMNQPRDRFKRLWADINGAESWEANPWVWAVEFRRVHHP